jgi:pSer/pThr/pTyr-binding forkhead associated (FHA) protein
MELMHDPVMAADGHTYDRSAIQRWLNNNCTSPKTGQELANTGLIENHNMKRLIEDLVEEGGLGLYTKLPTADSNGGLRALKKEKLMVLTCLESSSGNIGTTHYINQKGAEGGRMRLDSPHAASAMYIQMENDPTLSRRHFKVSYHTGRFWVSDLGSGTGTLVRIPHSNGHALSLGDLVCVGKHQFLVEDVSVATDGSTGQLERNVGESASSSIRLRCVYPSGSPLENKTFSLGSGGATLGRGPENTVSFTTRVGDKYRVVDTAVSAQHARIVHLANEPSPHFVVLDGSEERPSSNGTWMRLSPMHEPSREWPLHNGAQLVLGNSRFQVSMITTVIETSTPALDGPTPHVGGRPPER